MVEKLRCIKLFAILVFALASFYCAAQDQVDTLTYYIQTTDGNTYRGKILTQDSLEVLFSLERFGEHRFLKTEIKKLQPLEKKKLVGEEYWMDNPQATRYFFSPNAYGLKKGEGYYQNVWVMVNSFAVGLQTIYLLELAWFRSSFLPVLLLLSGLRQSSLSRWPKRSLIWEEGH